MTTPASPLTSTEEKQLRDQVVEKSIDCERYLRQHPEIGAVIEEVTREVLLRRPEEPVAYMEDYFATHDLHALYREILAKKAQPNLGA